MRKESAGRSMVEGCGVEGVGGSWADCDGGGGDVFY